MKVRLQDYYFTTFCMDSYLADILLVGCYQLIHK